MKPSERIREIVKSSGESHSQLNILSDWLEAIVEYLDEQAETRKGDEG